MQLAFPDSPEFNRLVSGEKRVDLARVALEIATDLYPDLIPDEYLARIDAMADRVRERGLPEPLPDRLQDINEVLFEEEGFTGNTRKYYDPRNSYLNEVLDRKVGIPISLSILYLAVAARTGLTVSGVNLPAHFLLRAGQGKDVVFIDAFSRGALLDTSGCEALLARLAARAVRLDPLILAPASPQVIVGRLLRNLKAIYLQSNDFASALPTLRRLTALDPRDRDEQRDLGLVCLYTQRPKQAIAHLQGYLHANPGAPDAATVGSAIAEAQRRLQRASTPLRHSPN